ncbi:UNVERIFIED_CONTAM: Early nodulin-like protein 2 [Sesamum radiatum]|uniref:Early nodulin-like protein 2 n=1 Tax=Sesamum radiatum TaxID=300843 RepID=A0AAW2KL30_SESRA
MAVCPSATGLLLVVLMRVLCSSHAHTFYVGGHDGWTLTPSEKYSRWAERYRFQINDELLFRYKKGQDSVLVVSKDDYSKCNKDNPIKNLKDGDSKFKFEKSGPFFFISGHDQNCEKGEKFIVVVLSHHHHHGTPISAPSLSPEAPLRPPSSSPSPSPTTVKTVPPVKPPNKAPAPAPSAHQTPTPLLEPEAPTHAPPPSHSASPAPMVETPSRPFQPRSHSPSPSPAAKTPTDSPPVESPSHSLPPSPAAESPSDHVGPHSHSPSTSPVAKTHQMGYLLDHPMIILHRHLRTRKLLRHLESLIIIHHPHRLNPQRTIMVHLSRTLSITTLLRRRMQMHRCFHPTMLQHLRRQLLQISVVHLFCSWCLLCCDHGFC